MKTAVFHLAMTALTTAATAAGIDPRAYTCIGLHSLVATNGYVFISQPFFGDFVVANRSFCSGSGSTVIQLRSVPTADSPECLVNYCVERNSQGRED